MEECSELWILLRHCQVCFGREAKIFGSHEIFVALVKRLARLPICFRKGPISGSILEKSRGLCIGPRSPCQDLVISLDLVQSRQQVAVLQVVSSDNSFHNVGLALRDILG